MKGLGVKESDLIPWNVRGLRTQPADELDAGGRNWAPAICLGSSGLSLGPKKDQGVRRRPFHTRESRNCRYRDLVGLNHGTLEVESQQ